MPQKLSCWTQTGAREKRVGTVAVEGFQAKVQRSSSAFATVWPRRNDFWASPLRSFQACPRGGRSDQVHGHLVTGERFAAPVLGDRREETVLDLVPIPGPAGKGQTAISIPVSSASFCNSSFQSRTREPLEPPPSAVMSRRLACGAKDLDA